MRSNAACRFPGFELAVRKSDGKAFWFVAAHGHELIFGPIVTKTTLLLVVHTNFAYELRILKLEREDKDFWRGDGEKKSCILEGAGFSSYLHSFF